MTKLILLFSLAAGAAFAQTVPVMHEIPLLTCSGLPCVELTSKSVNVMRLAIDLASVNGYLDVKTAQARGLKLESLKAAGGAEITAVQQTIVPGAKLGDLELGDFPFMVLDLSADPAEPKKKRATSFPADGALAFGSFKNRILQIDWERHLVRISEPISQEQPCPRDCGDLKFEHLGHYGPLTLTATGFQVDGKDLTCQIDTLFTGTMLIYPQAVDRLGLRELTKTRHKEEFPFFQNGVKLTEAESVNEGFHRDTLLSEAPVYFWTAKDVAPPEVSFDATIGAGLMSRALVTFDFKANHIWVEIPQTQ
ncbi:MAG: hypothetical protein JO061_04650 [Acidobacteriaceae bacterium]|nr:hypothetical protein [Acidobacteriaceae bacterium]